MHEALCPVPSNMKKGREKENERTQREGLGRRDKG
jgi:hypothetical protein